MSIPNSQDLEGFLDRINDVEQKVKDLLDDKVDLEAFDKEEFEEEKKAKIKEEMKESARVEKLQRGNDGKGHQNEYFHFCKFCFKEYVIEMPKCYHCTRDCMTKEERMTELREKARAFQEKEKI